MYGVVKLRFVAHLAAFAHNTLRHAQGTENMTDLIRSDDFAGLLTPVLSGALVALSLLRTVWTNTPRVWNHMRLMVGTRRML